MNSSKMKRLRVILILAVVILLIPMIGRAVACSLYPLKDTYIVESNAQKYGLDPSLIYAIIRTESRFNCLAVSSADAKGLMQITDDTFHWAQKRAGETPGDPSILFDAATNVQYGCYIIVLLSKEFNDIETVLAAYNAGQGHVREWLNDPAYSSDGKTLSVIPFEETATYVRRVLTAQERYRQLYNIQ